MDVVSVSSQMSFELFNATFQLFILKKFSIHEIAELNHWLMLLTQIIESHAASSEQEVIFPNNLERGSNPKRLSD